MIRTLSGFAVALLALGVAAYSLALLGVPGIRSPIASLHLAEVPLAAIAHFAGGGIAMAAGVFQFIPRIRTRWPAVHRWTGRAYVLGVLAGGAGSFAMAPAAFGGWVSVSGFGLLGIAWLATTFVAFTHIRARRIAQHREWMIRSYALTLAAVTLRLYLPAAQVAALPMESAYPAIAWLCWVPNLVLAELYIRAKRPVATAA